MMTKNKEFNKLQKENESIRKKIEEHLEHYLMSLDKEITWELINNLVENELQQEELCGD